MSKRTRTLKDLFRENTLSGELLRFAGKILLRVACYAILFFVLFYPSFRSVSQELDNLERHVASLEAAVTTRTQIATTDPHSYTSLD